MTDFTRREAITIMGAAAAVTLLPIDVQAERASPSLLAARDEAQAIVDAFDVNAVLGIAQYEKLFTRKPVALVTCEDKEREAQINADLRKGVKFISQARDGGQRWQFYIPHEEVGLGYAITRKAINEGNVASDMKATLAGLVAAFREYRETRAADVIASGWVYNANCGADGVSLFSDNHPHDDGVWSNTLGVTPLSEHALLESLIGIRTNAVDEAGYKIVSRGKLLVVPVAQMPTADRLIKTELRPGSASSSHNVVDAFQTLPGGIGGYMVYDYLTSNNNWFIKTDIDGLVFSEFEPLKITVEMDPVTDDLLIVGKEINGFGYRDPRAIFGVGRHDSETKSRIAGWRADKGFVA